MQCGKGWTYPHYLDPNYFRLVPRFTKEFASFIAELPSDVRSRIAWLQLGFGSTGDRILYKDAPNDLKYDIGSVQYIGFMMNMTSSLVHSV